MGIKSKRPTFTFDDSRVRLMDDHTRRANESPQIARALDLTGGPTMTTETPAPAEALSREQLEALFLPGDRVRVVSNRQDEEEDYTGHEGHVSAEASGDAQLSVSVILTAAPGFGAVLFEPAELELVTPGATRTLFLATLARAEAAEARVGALEALDVENRRLKLALLGLSPPSLRGKCWCSKFRPPKLGHSPECLQARAALAGSPS